jgi:phenylalanyl-tRNA synthetase beta chain
MKLPFSELKRFVPAWSKSAEELADLLTFSGTEVEGIEDRAGDRVLECAVTSNRVDCLGWLGLARDVAAVSGSPLAANFAPPRATGGPTADVVRIDVEDAAFCPRYVGVVVEGVKVGPSPEALRLRVERAGLRPVNNVVDVSNVVMFERNQPLHAFDLDRLRGGRVVVRRGRAKETLRALNGKDYALDPSMGLICDAEGPIAIAGVMGGADSETTEKTTRVLIESAYFDPASVRKTSRKLQLRSDASYRFERGIDRAGALEAALLAATLIVEVGGGTIRSAPLDVGGVGPEPSAIRFRAARVAAVGGVDVPPEECGRILTALGCGVLAGNGAADVFDVRPPAWRRDLSREIDLVEEIVRCVGLDRVPFGAGLRVMTVRPHEERALADLVRDRCVRFGLLECVTPTFVVEALEGDVAFASTAPGFKARNPIRAGEGAVRRSLLPSLLRVRAHNQDQGVDRLKLFEVANAAFDAPTQDAAVEQVPLLGALFDGIQGDKTIDGDVRDARGFVEELCESLGARPTFAAPKTPSPHLRADAQLEARLSGERLGVVGLPSRALIEAFRLRSAPVYVELDLRALKKAWTPTPRFTGLPKFPAVVRDLAFVLDDATPYAALEETLRGAAPKELESIAFFDEFKGGKLGLGKKSLALTLAFRSDDATLDGSAVDGFVAALVAAAEKNLGAKLRA